MKIIGITIASILIVAVITYKYFDLMLSDLSDAALFEEARIPHYL